ncbi:phage integrase family protein [Tahibacter aquaticus]|uniref:Phage integrase family protein n=1 Tax=Tahibacter aquaticus TaxID=520092 RepID=A0A4R6Z4Z3_9GAMM|nr:gamma-mobile-trio recombinase GmtY [Tahibacter aquaticus]TDR46768.1 phage integrase family protein [Tahibacter aquaticus]
MPYLMTTVSDVDAVSPASHPGCHAVRSCRFHHVTHEPVPSVLDPHRLLYVLWTWDEHSKPARFEPLVQYFEHLGRRCKPERQRRTARMVGLLSDFVRAHARSSSPEPVWAAFPEALVGGTEHLTGPLRDLLWPPASPRSARARLGLLNGFLEWLGDRAGSRTSLAPWIDPLLAARQAAHRAKHATLPFRAVSWGAHARGRAAAWGHKPVVHDRDAVAFDEARLEDLLFFGFRRRGARAEDGELGLDLRDVLITILLHAGGLRSCEPFHLFVDDVGVDPNDPESAEVRLYHPEEGWAPAHAQAPRRRRDAVRREEYLREWHGLVPRTDGPSGQRAGWKHLRLDRPAESYAVVRWFPTEWGRVFLRLFGLYLNQQRPESVGHPYLFVCDHGAQSGRPYTLQSYRQAHAVAVRRLGLNVAKALGTTPHAHRHAYGRRLAAAKLPKGTVQIAMHHRSPLSQEVYTQPTLQQVAEGMEEHSKRLRGRRGSVSALLSHGGEA